MKKPILLLVVALVVVALAFFLRSDREPQPSGDDREVKSDWTQGERLPGFAAKRESEVRAVDPLEMEPKNPVPDIEPVVLKEGQKFEDLSPEEIARIEDQQQEIAAMISRQQQDQFEVQLGELVKGLDLDEAQERELRAHFASIQGDIAAGDLQAYGRMAQILDGEDLEEVLKGVLSEEQLARHESIKEQFRVQNAKKEAASEMSHLNKLLKLSKAQAMQVQEILQESALTELQLEEGPDLAAQVETGKNLLETLQSAQPGENPLEALLRNRLAEERERRLASFEGVLTGEQIELYRQSLQAREGDLSRFQNSLNAFSQGKE